MEAIEYRDLLDKSGWGDGPWQTEPDKIQWQDKATGLPCLVVRNHFGAWRVARGAWCGYVGVSKTNPSYEKQYDVVDVRVHGGLTFSDKCQPDGEICHIVSEGEDDNVWWLGFDCGHGGDYSPGLSLMNHAPLFGDDVYRDLAYVKGEVEHLAAQLKAAPSSDDPLTPTAAA